MKQNKYAPVVKDNILRQEFSYSKGDTNLKFVLRVDRAEELLAFSELMKMAIKDIDELLAKFEIK